ncbi:hypothetical protein RhiirC2_788106 [Rhizophagus irregularis]|uniref:Serine-threonine/tyrosine-protein kinase catalytic domain-containing protein n=1 Tax=Rhizophagus irregularis TaxID=588596 RepID=A0A2N1MQT0_9GLOM|nr:hypothetical protein RhiirC2_788106 [Rhizophagus irregularis]
MEQCWDANPLKRPDINTLCNKMNEIMSYYRNKPDELPQTIIQVDKKTSSIMSSKIFASKIHSFKNLPEPKNAIEEEQEAFHSKSYDFSVPYNVDDFGKSSNWNTSKISSIIKDSSKKLSKVFKKLWINNQNDYNKKTVLTQNVNNEDDDEVYNNPNLHSEEQDEFEIPDDGF